MTLLAGAGRAEIALRPGDLPIDGFDAVLDPLHARVLLLDDGTRRVALTVLELTSVPDWAVHRYQGLTATAAAARPDEVVVAVSHTFSAPHLAPDPAPDDEADALRDAVDRAVRRAAQGAAGSLRPAAVRFGRGRCRIGVCRDVLTVHGWWLGADDTGPSDDDLPVLCIDRADGTTVALLASCAVQSSILDGSVTHGGRRVVSADLFGAASRHAELWLGPGAVTILLPAAAGDQAPTLTAVRRHVDPGGGLTIRDAHEAGHVLVDLLGERLGSALVRTARAARPVAPAGLHVDRTLVRVPTQAPPARREDLAPTRSYPFTATGDADVPVVLLGVGPVRVVGVQPELNARTGRQLRRQAGDQVVLATLVDGSAKYMADAASYERVTYEAMNSRFARGAAEALVAAVVSWLSSAPE